MKDNFLKKINKQNQDGYILIFTLIVMSIILFTSLSISKIIEKEVFFTRLTSNSREAYFAADSGIECAQYIDNVLRDNAYSISLILNSVTGTPKNDFLDNAKYNVFFATSSIPETLMTNANFTQKIFCSSDGSYNRVFYESAKTDEEIGYVPTRNQVLEYLNSKNPRSSYTISGNDEEATTTFSFVLKDINEDGVSINRCVIVDFYKKRSPVTNITTKYTIISTGFSSCLLNNPNTISRTIEQYSTN